MQWVDEGLAGEAVEVLKDGCGLSCLVSGSWSRLLLCVCYDGCMSCWSQLSCLGVKQWTKICQKIVFPWLFSLAESQEFQNPSRLSSIHQVVSGGCQVCLIGVVSFVTLQCLCLPLCCSDSLPGYPQWRPLPGRGQRFLQGTLSWPCWNWGISVVQAHVPQGFPGNALGQHLRFLNSSC